MAEGGTLSFSDPDAYTAAFGDIQFNLTLTGAGDFKAKLTRQRLKDLQLYLCCESLPRIAYFVLPPQRIFLSFPLDRTSLVSDGSSLKGGDTVLHGSQRTHQRSKGACRWGLISLPRAQFASCAKALTGRTITLSGVSKIIRPERAESLRLHRLLRDVCRLAESKRKLIERPEVARALEQELLHAIINCVSTNKAEDHQTRRRHATVMARFEKALTVHTDRRLSMPALCAEIGVSERSLRACCAKFLGVSPKRYILLRRLNKVRSMLQRADRSITSVAQVARSYQFHELGRFAVMYRTAFGESPSATLQRDPELQRAEGA
jgi:AraC-like DNA-binding protein